MKVAIVGMSPSATSAPWEDASWEKWGMPWSGDWAQMDRLFEIHGEWEEFNPSPDYRERLESCGASLYMQGNPLPGATKYPLAEVASLEGDYFESSVAFMMALAIYEGAEEISLHGVDMKSDEEYGYQKPNMEYMIGFARGRGIKVHVRDDSPLLKFSHFEGYTDRYGIGK